MSDSKNIKRIIVCGTSMLIVLLLTWFLTVSTLAAPPSYVHIYGQAPFDEAYSSGYINMPYPTGVGPGVSSKVIVADDPLTGGGFDWNIGGYVYYGSNTSKDGNIYIDYAGGAVMNGVPYDVRVYFWKTGERPRWLTSGGCHLIFAFNGADQNGQTHLEMHFYESGHCGDPSYETTFRGVLCHSDLDGSSESKEGYRYYSGHVGTWATSNTLVGFSNATNFYGTIVNENDNTPERQNVWCEVEGSPWAPLHLAYTTTAHGYGSGLNYWGARINYVLQSDGQYPLPAGAYMSDTHGSAINGTYRYAAAPIIDGWAFDGWYHDPGRTSHTGDTEVITGDKTVYGTYHRILFSVSTSVVNGSITPSNGRVNVGTNHVVGYSPNAGYLLQSITVDGTPVNISSYPGSYTFGNIQADHSISVVYVAPSASKTYG